MSTNTRVAQRKSAPERAAIGHVTSRDGTRIGYRQVGRAGPGVVILHGAMQSSESQLQLAEALADAFTVYLPDRRGRMLSGTFGEDYCMQREVEDLEALLAATGAHNVLGVSSGALITLQTMLTSTAITKAAIFEPPLIINGSLGMAWLARYDRLIAQGKVAQALTLGMKNTQMGPPFFNPMPDWLVTLSTRMMLASERPGDSTSMRLLAPTLHYDSALALEMANSLERFRAIQTPVLLLNGTQSPAYLQGGITALAQVMPNARRVQLDGLNHGATSNANRGGKPKRVAQELRRFFA